MGRTKDTRFTAALIKVLDVNEDAVRDNAAWALGEIGEEASLATLRKHQEDPNASVRENVLQAITKIEQHTKDHE